MNEEEPPKRIPLPGRLPALITPNNEDDLAMPLAPTSRGPRERRNSRFARMSAPPGHLAPGQPRPPRRSNTDKLQMERCSDGLERQPRRSSDSSIEAADQLSRPRRLLSVGNGRQNKLSAADPEAALRVTDSSGRSLRSPRPSQAVVGTLGRTTVELARAISRFAHGRTKRARANTLAGPLSELSESEAAFGDCSKASVDCGDTVISVSFSPDASLFAAGGNRNEVLVHSTSDGNHVSTLPAQAGVTCIRWARYDERTYLIVGTFSGVIRFFDAETAEELAACQWNRAQPITAMSVSDDGRTLAVGGSTLEFLTYSLQLVRRGETDASAASTNTPSPPRPRSGSPEGERHAACAAAPESCASAGKAGAIGLATPQGAITVGLGACGGAALANTPDEARCGSGEGAAGGYKSAGRVTPILIGPQAEGEGTKLRFKVRSGAGNSTSRRAGARGASAEVGAAGKEGAAGAAGDAARAAGKGVSGNGCASVPVLQLQTSMSAAKLLPLVGGPAPPAAPQPASAPVPPVKAATAGVATAGGAAAASESLRVGGRVGGNGTEGQQPPSPSRKLGSAPEPLPDLSQSKSELTFRVTLAGRASSKGNVNGVELERSTSSLLVVAGEARVVEVYSLDRRMMWTHGGGLGGNGSSGCSVPGSSRTASNPPSMPASPIRSLIRCSASGGPGSQPASRRSSTTDSSGNGTHRSSLVAASSGLASAIASSLNLPSLPNSPFRRKKAGLRWQRPADPNGEELPLDLTLRAHFLVSTAVHSIALSATATPLEQPSAHAARGAAYRGLQAGVGGTGAAAGGRHGGAALARSLLAVGASTHTELWSVLWERPRPLARGGRGSAESRDQGSSGPPSPQSRPLVAQHQQRRLAWRCEPIRRIEAAALSGGVAFSASALQLAVAGNERVSVHSIHDGAVLHVYKLSARARCVDIASTGSHVVYGGFDKKATLYKTNAGAELLKFASPVRNDIVRSVHKLRGFLAIGGESNGTGFAVVYQAEEEEGRRRQSHARIREWALSKPVWSVRVSPDRALCAVGGYDCCVHLFSMGTGEELCALRFAPVPGGPPAFVWSCAWAAQRNWLAIGCWNGISAVYAVGGEVAGAATAPPDSANASTRTSKPSGRAQDDGGTPGNGAGPALTPDNASLPLRASDSSSLFSPVLGSGKGGADGGLIKVDINLVREVTRRDRVYSVALNEDGTRLVVGGRDQCVALYVVESGELLWEFRDSDFIYTVAISNKWTRVAYGGMSKKLVVLDAASGKEHLELPVGGTVWTVALSADGTKVACGGELPHLSVYETEGGAEVVVLPTHEPVYDSQLSTTSLCFASGDQGVVYGKGGQSYGWNEGPSYEVASSILRSPLTADEQRLRFLRTTLAQHPTLVNMTERGSRCCLLKMLVESTADPAIISLVLSVKTEIGLIPDVSGMTALDTALEQANRKTIRRILDAVQQGSISRAPGSIEQVMRNFAALAQAFPHELLRFVKQMPLEPEPEVLADTSRSDTVVLKSMLVAGSMERSPRGIWDAELRRIRDSSAGDERGALPSAGAYGARERAEAHRASPRPGAAEAVSGRNSRAGPAESAPPLMRRLSGSARWTQPAAGASERRGENGAPPLMRRLSGSARWTQPAAGASERRPPRLTPLPIQSPTWYVPGSSSGWAEWLTSLCPQLASAWAERADGGGGGAGAPGGLAERRGSAGPDGLARVPLHAGFGGSSVSSGLSAMRVPLPDFAGWAHAPAGPDGSRLATRTSHLELIVAAAVRTHDYSVFDSKAVEALMEYKWKAFAGGQFHQQLFFYTLHLLTLCVYCTCMRDASEVQSAELRSWLIDTNQFQGPFLLLGWTWTTLHTAYVVFHESGQVRHSGFADYFADEWNIVDLCRIVTQMAISVYLALIVGAPAALTWALENNSFLSFGFVDHTGHAHACPPDQLSPTGECPGRAGADDEFAAPFLFDGQVLTAEWAILLNLAGLSVILNSLKLFNYMRGFAQLGALVQMIMAILSDMIPFMVVLGILVFGFAFALTILPSGQRRYEVALWNTVNAGLYNNFNAQNFYHAGPYNAVLVQSYQLLVQVVLLNLLVAIMADSYRQVKSRTKQAAKFERARVIGEMETSPQLLSALLRKLFQRQEEWVRAPRWLHVLDNDERAAIDDDDAQDGGEDLE